MSSSRWIVATLAPLVALECAAVGASLMNNTLTRNALVPDPLGYNVVSPVAPTLGDLNGVPVSSVTLPHSRWVGPGRSG
jgi:hypothetical protein